MATWLSQSLSSYGSRLTYEEGIQVGSPRWQVHPYCPAFSPPIQPPAAAALPHRSQRSPRGGLEITGKKGG